MCGIIAYTGVQNAAPILMAGLHRLEYRGYDSAGIALHSRNKLQIHRAEGKLAQLESKLPSRLSGKSGMGHTRWATHGEANESNAHPHTNHDGSIAIIHNGIIENAGVLRTDLEAEGVVFKSETDSEVLAHLISRHSADSLIESVRRALTTVQGTYGLVVMDAGKPGEIVAARNGSPVIIGLGEKEMFVTSDANAILNHTREVIHLDDGELAAVNAKGFSILTQDATGRIKSPITISAEFQDQERGKYPHFMLKEIHEQPQAVERTIKGRLDHRFDTAHLGGLNLTPRELLDIRRVKILGCGSAYYAGISGANMIEHLARLPSSAEPAAEFRYRNPLIESDTLYIVVSQSGETFDTLAALREIKRKGGRVLGINNVVGSTIAREVDGGIYMHAGPEISVASTKAFSCMLASFMLLALQLGRVRDLSPQQGKELITAIEQLPELIEKALQQEKSIRRLASKYCKAKSAFFIGRTNAFPVALEGALKIKEVSYIHAEAYPASELKHGPLALIDPDTPTVVVLPDDNLLEKSLSSLQEIRARKGPVISITNSDNQEIERLSNAVIQTPSCHPLLFPLVMGVSLQLFAYYCAIAMGRDVDQPRNLAKSVTVE
ncbi:MAG: glutamine--fructose-6-phosphate transaminase (isomerizing) [bacterium]